MQSICPKGFSLIELMIVVSIIGILAVIAFPSYQHYIARSRFAEVIFATEIYKIAVSLALQEGVPLKEISNGKNGIPLEPKSTKNLTMIKVTQGIITAKATELVKNATYILTPNSDGSSWSISGSCLTLGLCND